LPLLLLWSLAVAGAPGCRASTIHKLRAKPKRVLSAPRQLVPLIAAKGSDQLALEHFDAAVVSIPVGARWPRPVVVAIHGRGDSPEANCDAWSTITSHDYFVLCPALRALPNVAGNPSTPQCSNADCLADEMREALPALRKRFGRYVAKNEVILAGFGTGAGQLVPVAMQDPAVFPIVWLANGGLKQWATALSTTYVERGGKLLGLVCSDTTCGGDIARVVASANAAGLKTAVAEPGQLGVTWDARLVEATRIAWQSSKPKGWPWSTPGQIGYVAKTPVNQ